MADNVEQPVAFVSKCLTATQVKWAIIQKEAFAIFYAFKNLKSILRDHHFTVHTDHRNLCFIKTDSNPMIIRWWVDMQEYNYTLEDILCSNNPVADGFSRLVANHMEPFVCNRGLNSPRTDPSGSFPPYRNCS